jgi:hypothetical protein
MSNKAFVVVQDLTYTENEYGLGVTITYAAASALSVSVVGHAITVHLKTGVSTATQVKAAIDAYEYSHRLVTVAVTGTGSTIQIAASSVPTAGAVGPGAQAYYADGATVALTGSYVIQWFGFHGNVMTLSNDETTGSKTLWYSYDGVNDHGKLGAGQSLTFDIKQSVVGLFLKNVGGAPAYRLMVR